jgi:hypothetical protein
MSIQEVRIALKEMFAAFPEAKAGDETALAYLRQLQDIPHQELVAVIYQAMRESVHLPRIATLIELHRKLHSGVTPDKAAEGWAEVQKALRSPLTYTPDPNQAVKYPFTDPITARVVKAIGWSELKTTTVSNIPTLRAQFMRMYESMAKGEVSDQRLTTEYRQLQIDNSKSLLLEIDNDTY